MLTVGSRALQTHGFDYVALGRIPKDTDFICTYEDYAEWVSRYKKNLKAYYPVSGNKYVAFLNSSCGSGEGIFEFEIAWPGSTGEELLAMEAGRTHASAITCLALKLSHRYLKNSPAFLKTMGDIHMLRSRGYQIEPASLLGDWLKRREKETYSYKHPKLDQSKKGFFDASVKYTYDHDAIHKAVAYGDVPAYTRYMADGAEVNCDKKKFFALAQEERLQGVAEEAYVLALERSIIPHPGVLTPKKAFDLALMKVCTSITSGWFREFAWENYWPVQAIYRSDFVINFEMALNAGRMPLAVTN